MRQQINLINLDLGEKHNRFGVTQIGGVLACALVLIGLYGGYSYNQYLLASAHNAQQKKALARATEQMARLSSAAATLKTTVPNKEIDNKRKHLTDLQLTAGALKEQRTGARTGYAKYLQELAEYRTDGVWLSEIIFDKNGHITSLHGFSLSPDLIPAYMKALQGAPSLAGTSFTSLHIKQNDKPNPGTAPSVEFELFSEKKATQINTSGGAK